MRVKALSHYDGDKDTRFGDCILGFSGSKLMIYDCGHERHADEVKEFLEKNTGIRNSYENKDIGKRWIESVGCGIGLHGVHAELSAISRPQRCNRDHTQGCGLGRYIF